MIINYFKIVLRNINKHKVYSLINIFGLSIGLTCSMLIIIYVYHELSYDRFHENADRIFRLGSEVSSAEGKSREPLSSAPTGKMLLHDYPEIIDQVRFCDMGKTVISYGDNQFYEKEIYYSDPSVFHIFTLPMLKGNPKTALEEPYSVVITRRMAVKYFSNEEPVGKALKFNNKSDFTITGVIENLPSNTHLDFNMLCSFETLYDQNDLSLNNWLNFNCSTYLLLNANTNYKILESKLQAFIKRYIDEDNKTNLGNLSFYLNPLKKIHLYSNLDGNPPGLISRVILYSLLAIFLILIVCINFTNLSTAQSINRTKEIGLRKVVGAKKRNLVIQFLSETMVLSFFALIITLIAVKYILPFFSNNVEEKLELNLFEFPGLFIGFFILTFFVGIFAGSYPAFYLARFQPSQILKNISVSGKKRNGFRNTLVIIQFVVSIILISQTMLLDYQLTYLKNRDIGFHKKDMMVLPVYDEMIIKSIPLLKKELKNHPNVLNITATSSLPGFGIKSNVKIPEGFSRTDVQLMDDINVDNDFIPALDIKLIAGRNFSNVFTTDEQDALIINQLAAKKFGWSNPIGKIIQYSVGQDQFAAGIIIGVVKDFHLSSMHRVIEPLFISNHLDNLNHILIRIKPEQVPVTIDFIREKWKDLYPNYPFQYSFLEDSYDKYFRNIEKVVEVLSFFSVIAIILACLGIFALAMYITEQRRIEIGIRKTFGDTMMGIVLRLNKELLKYVLIATVFVIPYAYLTKNLLQGFLPYLDKTNYFIYIKGIVLVFIVALFSISYQSVKSALANPVDSLRCE
ncbi:MAG: ABC transporter permease [Bacteroidales bacterium]|nr:ABC transporter permease [Bacteroidales bacterium]